MTPEPPGLATTAPPELTSDPVTARSAAGSCAVRKPATSQPIPRVDRLLTRLNNRLDPEATLLVEGDDLGRAVCDVCGDLFGPEDPYLIVQTLDPCDDPTDHTL